MAFSPNPNSYYRVVFKNSGLCMAVANNNQGAPVTLAKADAAADGQLWRMRRHGQPNYIFTSKIGGKALDVPRGSRDDDVGLVQWDQRDSEENQHFRLLPAGNGYYYMVSRSSGKRICPKGGSSEAGVAVVQNGEGATDAYQVRIVEVGEGSASSADRDFVDDANRQIRELVILAVGKLPEVGSILGPLLGVLWPATDPNKLLWDQMKRYVVALVREMIAEERLVGLRQRLAGIQSSLKDYNDEAFGSKRKAATLEGLLSALNNAEPFFFDTRDPEKTLPYFVVLGTIRLAALRELCVNYKRIYGSEDDNPAVHLEKLQTNIMAYSRAAEDASMRALAWRLGKIHVVKESKRIGIPTIHTFRMVDEYDGTSRDWWYNDTNGGGDGAAEAKATMAAKARREEVTSQFGAELHSFFGPARLWKYLDPTFVGKPVLKVLEVSTGPFGDYKYPQFNDDPHDLPITDIHLYAGNQIDGIELYYGGQAGGVHGGRGGRHYHWKLENGETIIGVWGTQGGPLFKLYFATSHGRQFGAGSPGTSEWVGDPPANVNASLYRIGGRQGKAHLDAIQFYWRYTLDE